jgi:hypothetical protein
MKRIGVLLLVVSAAGMEGCHRSTELVVGGVYSVTDEDGGYRIAKLLVHDGGVCHIRLYKQTFSTRPSKVDPQTLSLGTPDDADGFGMGHLPLREASFHAWDPVLISTVPVRQDELDGYKMWKESGGGVF